MKPKQIFYIIVCIISFWGTWAVILRLSVYDYLNWDFILSTTEFLVAMLCGGMVFMLGIDIYRHKIRKKIFKRDDNKNNKAA
jgi:hypothetical protein